MEMQRSLAGLNSAGLLQKYILQTNSFSVYMRCVDYDTMPLIREQRRSADPTSWFSIHSFGTELLLFTNWIEIWKLKWAILQPQHSPSYPSLSNIYFTHNVLNVLLFSIILYMRCQSCWEFLQNISPITKCSLWFHLFDKPVCTFCSTCLNAIQ